MTKEKELQKSMYDRRIVTESEVADNVAYEVKNRAVCVTAFQGGRKNIIYGSIPDMRKLAAEIIQVCDMWEDVRT